MRERQREWIIAPADDNDYFPRRNRNTQMYKKDLRRRGIPGRRSQLSTNPRTSFSQSDTPLGLVTRKVVDARVRLSRGIGSRRSTFEDRSNGAGSSCYPRYPANLAAPKRFRILRPMSIESGQAKTKTRARNEGQRDGAWSVGDQIVVASTGQGLPKSAGLGGSAERTRTSILPAGPLTCRESNGRRFDKSGGSAGVNVASFFLFPTIISLPFLGGLRSRSR